jgi:hypothetical protein
MRWVGPIGGFGAAAFAAALVARALWVAPALGPAPAFAAVDSDGATWSSAVLWGEPYLAALGAPAPVSGIRAFAFGGSGDGWIALPASAAPAYAIPSWTVGTPTVLVDAGGTVRAVVGLPAGRATLERRIQSVSAEARHPWLARLDRFVCR